MQNQLLVSPVRSLCQIHQLAKSQAPTLGIASTQMRINGLCGVSGRGGCGRRRCLCLLLPAVGRIRPERGLSEQWTVEPSAKFIRIRITCRGWGWWWWCTKRGGITVLVVGEGDEIGGRRTGALCSLFSIVYAALCDKKSACVTRHTRGSSHLVVPTVPSLSNHRLQGRQLLVGHVERAQQVLFQQRRTRKREQQRRRKRLPSNRWALRERGFVGDRCMRRGNLLQIVRDDGRILRLWRVAVVNVLHGLHHVVAHVEAQFPHLAFLDHPPMFPLSLPRCRAYSVSPLNFRLRQFRLLDVRRVDRRWRGWNVLWLLLQRMVRGWWRVLRMLLLLLLVCFRAVRHHPDRRIPVPLPFPSLSLCCLFAFDPLTLRLPFPGSFA